jgi:transglutaminase-like putative cysteine protease
MILDVEHRLWLEYDGFIQESFIELRLQPKTTPGQSVASFVLAVGPPAKIHRYRDWNDNFVHHFSITKFHDRVEARSRSLVETRPAGPGLDEVGDVPPFESLPPAVNDWLFLGGPLLDTPRLRRFAASIRIRPGTPLGEQVRTLSAHLRRHFRYEKNVTRYDSTTDDFLRGGAGVCQDFTHLMLALLRLHGVPARYVSGYLHVEHSPEAPAQSHAWIEFYSPFHGWVPFDPTHDRELDERYVVVAHGRSYDDVPPNKGIYRGNAREALRAEVRTQSTVRKDVADLHEELQDIDVPVFQEVPPRRPERAIVTAAEEEAAQQQQ